MKATLSKKKRKLNNQVIKHFEFNAKHGIYFLLADLVVDYRKEFLEQFDGADYLKTEKKRESPDQKIGEK